MLTKSKEEAFESAVHGKTTEEQTAHCNSMSSLGKSVEERMLADC